MGNGKKAVSAAKTTRHIILLLTLLLLVWGAVLTNIVLFIYTQWEKGFNQKSTADLKRISFSISNIIRETENALDYLIGENTAEALLDIDTPEKLARNRALLKADSMFTGDVVVMSFQNGKSYTSHPFIDAQAYLEAMRLNTSNIQHLFETRGMPYEFIGLQPRESSQIFAKLEKFCMVRPLASSADGSVIGMILVTFNRSQFRNITGISVLEGSKEFVMLNYRDEPCLATRGMFLPEVIRYDTLGYGLNPQYGVSARGEAVRLYAEAEQPQGYRCLLVSLRPEFHFFEMKGAPLIAALSGAAFLFLVFFLVSYVRKSRSILRTQNLLLNKGNSAITQALLSNKQTLENLAAKELLNLRSMQEKIHISMADTRFSVLSALLSGNVQPYEQVENLAELGIEFPGESFAVLFFRCRALEQAAKSRRAEAAKEWDLLEFVIGNIIGEYHACATLQYKDGVVAIVNPLPGAKEMVETADLVCAVCRSELDAVFCVGVSRTVGSLARVGDAYQESRLVAAQAAELNKPVLSYTDALKMAVPEQDYAQLIEAQYYLLSACRNQSWEDAAKLLDHICGRILAQSGTDVRMLNMQVLDMMNAMIRQLDGDRCFPEEDMAGLSELVYAVMECQSAGEIQEVANRFSAALRVCAAHAGEAHSQAFVRQVHDIINTQYANIDLSVAYIADLIGYNPKALSAAYKQKTDRGLLDAIHTKRVEEARRLLEETDKSVVEISSLTGYENVNTFIRVFKRYSGVTPGGYRDSLGKR